MAYINILLEYTLVETGRLRSSQLFQRPCVCAGYTRLEPKRQRWQNGLSGNISVLKAKKPRFEILIVLTAELLLPVVLACMTGVYGVLIISPESYSARPM